MATSEMGPLHVKARRSGTCTCEHPIEAHHDQHGCLHPTRRDGYLAFECMCMARRSDFAWLEREEGSGGTPDLG